ARSGVRILFSPLRPLRGMVKRMRHGLPLAAVWGLALVAGSVAFSVVAQERERPDRIAGKPNLNGIWQAMGTAHWNLEGHSAEQIEEFWQLGAIAAIP